MEKEFLNVLERAPLFAGIRREELESMLACLSAERRNYARGEFLLHAGDPTDSLGVVLRGRVLVFKEDFWGNRNLLAELEPGQSFAESYACVPGEALGVSVQAAEAAECAFLKVQRILTTCPSACAFHARLIRNLLSVLAAKNLQMNAKLTHLTQRSTREKLLSYLSAESLRSGSAEFEIPFDRQQLADYLSVDRSAMSAELGRMRDEGLVRFRRNRFTLVQE
jgi:cAMP-binding proteins - catabolite gene activator and regulatory subunit of cAMP-dependent protein kinases